MSSKHNRTGTTSVKVPQRLKKITSLMLASAVLSSVSLHAAAQALNTNLSGIIDGGMGTGYLITGDSRFQGSSVVQIGRTDTQSLVHSFKTVGGAGSGGGAGLGGAFFVDADATLTVINTDFANNRAQGGNGGSAAPVSYAGQLLNIIGRNVELNQVPATQVNLVLEGSNRFTRSVSNGVVTYGVSQVSVPSDAASLLIKDAPAIFTDFNVNNTTTISNITSSGLVTLSAPVTTTATILPSFVAPNNPSPFIKTYVAVKDQQGNDTTQVIETVTTNRLFTGGTSGFTATGDTLSFGYGFNLKTVDEAVAQPPGQAPVMKPKMVLEAVDIPGAQNLSQGDKVFIGVAGEPAQVLANVLDVIRFTPEEDAALNANNSLTGKPKAVILDRPVSPLVTSIEVIKQPTFNVIPFAVNNSDRTLVQSYKPAATYLPGMTVSWESNGTTVTAKIVQVIGGSQVKLDKPVPEGITDLKFVENPLTGDNTVRVTNAAATFKPGQVVYVPSATQQTFVGVVKRVGVGGDPDLVEVEPENVNQKLADFYDPNLGLGLKKSAAEVTDNNRKLTVPFNTAAYGTGAEAQQKISALLKDRLVKGSAFDDGTTVSSVQVGNGTVTITLSDAATTNVIESLILSSPLVMGGNMNGLTDTVARDSDRNGSDGYSANGASSFFNDAEGVDGTNGAGAQDNQGGVGYNGGKGGNGSNGLPVNFWLVYDVTVAGIQMKQATRNLVVAGEEFVAAGTDLVNKLAELAGVAVPDPQAGLGFTAPDPLEIAAAGDQVKAEVQELRLKTKNLINAKFDVAWAISDLTLATTNLGKWATELGLGLAGLGGAGGDGGQASGGADFFGGGGGGAGGNGGSGAISISDGGDGGTGGMGGAGGFGAGGGQGGEGGLAGANGNASGGDPGEGGYAGFGAGQGANGDGMFGGGGSGLGGSIFVRAGGTLLIQGNSRFSNNNVAGGSTSSEFGEAGSEAGTDLFMMKGSSVRLQPGEGKTIQFDGTIADDSFGTNDGYQHAAGYGADLRIGGSGGNGGGLVLLNGENTYSGHTILEGATLSAELGMGVNDLSLIRFNGSGSISVDVGNNAVNSTLSLDSAGTLLLTEDFTRLAGTDPGEAAWTGSGGFASGVKGLLTVNLGAINDEGLGQNLVWGSDGFFTTPPDGNGAANNGVLTFGSDYSEGWVEFTNNVNLNGNTARVAVYKNNNDYRASNATLSGNWVNTNGTGSALVVGDSSGSNYNGTLFMTGQNQLDNLVVAGGTLSTYNGGDAAGRLFKSTANLVVMADQAGSDERQQQSNLQLFANEQLTNVTVLRGGQLTLTQRLTATGSFENRGSLFVLGTHFGDLTDEDKARVIGMAGMSDYLPSDYAAWQGELVVNGDFVNRGLIDQYGSISARNLVNGADSVWRSTGNMQAAEDFINAAVFDSVGNIGATRDVINTGTLGLTGDLSAGRDLSNSEDATVNVDGRVTVGRDLDNLGDMSVSGAVTVGGHLVNADSMSAGSVSVVAGNLTNGGALSVAGGLTTSSGFVSNLGTISVGNSASVAGYLDNLGSMTVLDGGLTVAGAVNNQGALGVKGNTRLDGRLDNSSTGLFAVTEGNVRVADDFVNDGNASVGGALDVGDILVNRGQATVDAAVTVGTYMTNSGRFTIKQGGLSVARGHLSNSGLMDVTGDTVVETDLINNNGGSQPLANLAIKEGGLLVKRNVLNMGALRVAEKATSGGSWMNGTAASLTVESGGLEIGGSFTNSGTTHVTGEASVVGNVVNNTGASMTVEGGGLLVQGAFTNNGSAMVDGDSLVRFDIVNSGNLGFQNDLRVVGSLRNNAGVVRVDGQTSVEFDVINTAGVATFGNGVHVVTGHLHNLAASGQMPGMSITGDVRVDAGNLVNEGALEIVGNTTTGGSVTNTGGFMMTGDLTTASNRSVTNHGYWGILEDAVIRTGTLQGNTGAVFCLSTAGNAECAANDAVATHLTVDVQSENSSVFAGVFAGSGSLTKTGQSDLLLTSDQTFSGGLTVDGGRFIAAGKLNDDLNITVNNGGTYVVATDDIVRSVVNNAPRSVVLEADLRTTDRFVNNGRLVVSGAFKSTNGVTVLESVLDAGTGGFSGSAAGRVEIDAGATLRLKQAGDSVYFGQISRGDNESALVKEGAGTLTLSDTVDLRYVTVAAGELALNKALILSRDAIVNIAQGAKLSLLAGNQSIETLLGAGTLNLGTNNLTIARGGNFNGVINGTGQVEVGQGSFSISSSLSTTGATFVVRDDSETNLGNTASLAAENVDVHGTFVLGQNASSTAELTAPGGVNVFDGGQLKGTGTIKDGVTTIHAGGMLMPGHSPGLLVIENGLQLNSGSTTVMEIQNPAGNPGVGFDQVRIGENADFSIDDGAELEIRAFGGDPAGLAQGQTIKIFDFTPGKVEGRFGSVSSNVNGVGALSLATGNLVYLGGSTMAQIRNSAASANEQAIYEGLLQSTEGGVHQFYGGQFIERLVSSAVFGREATKAVFNAYNPESYLGLSDLGQAAAQDALPVWKSQLGNTDKLFAYTASTSRANQQHADHQAYGLTMRSSNIGATRQWGDKTVLMSFGVVDPQVRGNYVSADGNGFNVGLSLYGSTAFVPNGVWYVGLSHANLKMRGTRSVAQARFEEVGTHSTQVEAGLETRYSLANTSYVNLKGSLAVGQARRDGVNEVGSVNSLNTLTVHADKYSYNRLALAVELGTQVSSATNLYAALNYEAGSQNKRSVSVGYDNNQARFSVDGRSAMASNARLMGGVRHQYSADTSFEASIGLARAWNGGSDTQARIGFMKKF